MPSKYAWRFPDGEVIPLEDEFAIYTKLRASDDFVNRVSDDEYHRGYWYTEQYEAEIGRIIEDPESLAYFDVRLDSERGPVYVLPDGTPCNTRMLVTWLEEVAYPFERWMRENRFSTLFFQEVVEREIDYLVESNDPESLRYYGIERVMLTLSPSKRGSSGGKPKGKAPAKKTTKPKSASVRTKAGAKPKTKTKSTKGVRR